MRLAAAILVLAFALVSTGCPPSDSLSDVWGTSSSDVYAVGWGGTILHYDGHAWEEMPSGTTEGLSGDWGASSSDVFAVGRGNTILHYDGRAWSPMTGWPTSEE